MKKMVTWAAAVVAVFQMGFSAFAGAIGVKSTFEGEGYVAGEAFTPASTSEANYWGPASEASVKAYEASDATHGSQYLALDSGAATRYVFENGATATKDANADVYFEGRAQIAGTDAEPELNDEGTGLQGGGKIVLWMYDDGEGTRELRVTAQGVTAGALTGKAVSYPLTVTAKADTDWYDVKIKTATAAIGTGVPGFEIYLDGAVVTDAPCANYNAADATKLTVFPSLSAEDVAMTSIEFSGSGALDTLSFTKVVYVAQVGNVKYETLADALAAVETAGGAVTVLSNTATWPENFALANGVTVKLGEGVTDFNAPADYKWDDAGNLVIAYVEPVCAIGEGDTAEYYQTLQAAIDAVADNATEATTIVLIGNATENGTEAANGKDEEAGIKISASKKIVLDLGAKTLFGNILSEGDLTIKNGTLASEVFINAIESKGATAKLTLIGTEEAPLTVTSQRHVIRIDGGEATIDGGTYTAVGRKGKEETAYTISAGGNATTLTIEGGIFNGHRYNGNYESGDSGAVIQARANAIITIKGGTYAYGAQYMFTNKGTIVIPVPTAATFDKDPSEYFAESTDGKIYAAALNDDNMYAIVQMSNWLQVADLTWFNADTYETTESYTLDTAKKLAGLAKLVNAGTNFAGKTITLAENAEIDFSALTWPGIGIYSESDNSKAFQGTFNGNGATLKGVVFGESASGLKYRGFFNQIYNATVQNLTIEVKGFESTTTGTYGGAAIAGFASDSTIADCVATGSFTATHNLGGIVVRIKNANILRCTNETALTGNYTKMGGIVALSQNSTTGCLIEGCVNKGAITSTASGTDGVGGIIGWIGSRSDDGVSADEGQRVTIKDCENSGTITGTSTAIIGQIVGKPFSYWSIEGANKGLTTTLAVGYGETSGLNYGLVTDGVVTYVSNLEAGKTYLVTAPNAKPGITLAAGQSITFDTTLAAIDATGIKATTKLVTMVEDNETTYLAAVATVGENGYATLDEALEAAQTADDKTVILYADVAWTENFALADGVTIKLGDGIDGTTASVPNGYEWKDGVLVAKVYVAEINGAKYETVQAAIDAATEGQAVKILKDVKLEAMLTIAAEKNITLDLNGKAITVAKSGDRSLYAIENSGTFTLTDSVGEGSITARGAVKNYATFVMNGGTIYTCDTNGGYGVWNYADFTMNGGAIMTTHWVGNFQSPSTPTCLRNENSTSKITLNGGTIKSTNVAVYAVISVGTLVIPAESTVSLYAPRGVAVDAGTATIAGGSFTTFNARYSGENGGYVAAEVYYPLYVYKAGATVEVTGGTFTVENDDATQAVATVQVGSTSGEAVTSSVTIKGGTFNAPLVSRGATPVQGVKVEGGKFASDPACVHDANGVHYSFAAEGKIGVKGADGYYTLNDGAYVAKTAKQCFATVDDAVAAAEAATDAADKVVTVLNGSAVWADNFALVDGVTIKLGDGIDGTTAFVPNGYEWKDGVLVAKKVVVSGQIPETENADEAQAVVDAATTTTTITAAAGTLGVNAEGKITVTKDGTVKWTLTVKPYYTATANEAGTAVTLKLNEKEVFSFGETTEGEGDAAVTTPAITVDADGSFQLNIQRAYKGLKYTMKGSDVPNPNWSNADTVQTVDGATDDAKPMQLKSTDTSKGYKFFKVFVEEIK